MYEKKKTQRKVVYCKFIVWDIENCAIPCISTMAHGTHTISGRVTTIFSKNDSVKKKIVLKFVKYFFFFGESIRILAQITSFEKIQMFTWKLRTFKIFIISKLKKLRF